MLPHDKSVIHSSKEPNHRTPPALFAALDREFYFDLDAAADATNTLCQDYFGPGSPLAEDALAAGWYGKEAFRIFLNPPWSRAQHMPIEPWIAKCWAESQAGATIAAVVPHAVQTVWWRRYVLGQQEQVNPGEPWGHWGGHAAMEIRELPHRVTFLRPDGTPQANAPGNTAVVIWKPNPGYVGPWRPWTTTWSYR